MFKILSLSFFMASFCGASVIQIPLHPIEVEAIPLESQIEQDLWAKWGPHVTDFLNLIDLEKVMAVVMQHVTDPDVMNFVEFILSEDFKKTVADFQTIEEFKQAVDYLQSKGYNAQAVIDIINSNLDSIHSKHTKKQEKIGSGVTDLIEEVVHTTLPVDEIKDLFLNKLQNNKEVADLFEAITAPEFLDIAKRMAENPKFVDIKNVFDSHGLDFKRLEKLVKEVVGDFFEGLV